MRARDVSAIVYVLSLTIFPFGIYLRSVELMALCTVTAGFGYALRDYFSPEPESNTVMTCYAAFAALWFGLGNLVGYLLDPDAFPQFHTYAVPEFLFEAQVLASLGAILPLVAFDAVRRRRPRGARRALLPLLGYDLADREILWLALSLLSLGWATRLLGLQFGFLGTVGGLISMGPALFIFIISARWRSPAPTTLPQWTKGLAIAVMVFEAVMALLFSNMRNTIIWPVAAYFLPFLLRKQITVRRLAVGVLLVLTFSLLFKSIGEVRGELFGSERLAYIVEQARDVSLDIPAESGEDALGITNVLARLSTFNQLTQVVRLVEDEGFYEGETIGYAVYVFVPRLIWPEKPSVAPGQWFARKLGRGQELGGARFSNAINMTIPGELYLNFGWIAVVVCMFGVGLLYFYLWETARFFSTDSNPVGQAFGYILFGQAMFNGSHIGGVFNLVLWYISLLAVGWALKAFVLKRGKAKDRSMLGGGPERRVPVGN